MLVIFFWPTLYLAGPEIKYKSMRQYFIFIDRLGPNLRTCCVPVHFQKIETIQTLRPSTIC